MNPITLSALVLLTAFAAKGVKAQDLPVPYNHVEYKQAGNSFTWNPLTGKTPSAGGVIFRGDTTISNAQPKISTMARLPFDKRGDVPVSQMMRATSPFSKANFAKALTAAGRVAWPVGVLMTAGEIINYMQGQGLFDIQNDGNQITAKKANSAFAWSDPAQNGSYPSALVACRSYYGSPPAGGHTASATVSTDGKSAVCKGVDGNAQATVYSVLVGGSINVLNQTQIEDLIAANTPGWPSSAARALQSALSTPGVSIKTDPPAVSGPSSIPGSTSSTTTSTSVSPGTTTEVPKGTPGAQPATKTTNSTTTNNATYNNNNVTHNTKTITTTTITNNITNQTETTTDKEETKEEQDKEDESPPTDTDLTKVPELYERKYPDGMVGIWNTKSEEIKQSPLFTLADDLMPTGISGGSCPSWSLDLSFGGSFGDYGAQDVSPPCWIWDVARLIIIASALILARALVFGG